MLHKFIYTEESCGRKYLKINLFGLKLSFNISLKNNTNNIYLKSPNGKLTKVKKVKGLKVIFKHSNSTVIIHEPIQRFENPTITLGENCHFEIGAKTKDKMVKMSRVNFSQERNSKIIIGDNLFFGSGNVILGEGATLKVGDDCMFSYGITFRIGDGHTIINTETGERILSTGNVTVGDRVWIGMQSIILKNAQIANDTIVGAGSIVAKKFDKTNVAIAGNPAKIIKENVAWEK